MSCLFENNLHGRNRHSKSTEKSSSHRYYSTLSRRKIIRTSTANSQVSIMSAIRRTNNHTYLWTMSNWILRSMSRAISSHAWSLFETHTYRCSTTNPTEFQRKNSLSSTFESISYIILFSLSIGMLSTMFSTYESRYRIYSTSK